MQRSCNEAADGEHTHTRTHSIVMWCMLWCVYFVYATYGIKNAKVDYKMTTTTATTKTKEAKDGTERSAMCLMYHHHVHLFNIRCS